MASEDNKNRPKATPEVVKEYEEILKVAKTLSNEDDKAQISVLFDRVNELEKNYDWFSFSFTDPATGKKGLKDVSGQIVVPAKFDDFAEFLSYIHFRHAPVIVINGGKFGIVRGDGSGQELCACKFDNIRSLVGTGLYMASWEGVVDRFGLITANGNVICPNILTSYYYPFNGILIIESNKKLGVIDLDTYQCVLPEYDDLDADPGELIVFHKDGKEWYITDEGERITKEQYENDENYEDVYCLNAFY